METIWTGYGAEVRHGKGVTELFVVGMQLPRVVGSEQPIRSEMEDGGAQEKEFRLMSRGYVHIGGFDGPPSLPMATAESGHDPCRLAAVTFLRACEAGDSGGRCVCFRDKAGSCIVTGVGFDTTAASMANGRAANACSFRCSLCIGCHRSAPQIQHVYSNYVRP